MEILIYGSHHMEGYSVLGSTKEFSHEIRSYILSLSRMVRNPLSPTSKHSIAFRPLEDYKTYLLSVALRYYGGTRPEDRNSYSIVHYILDGSEADDIFASNPYVVLKEFINYSESAIHHIQSEGNIHSLPRPKKIKNSGTVYTLPGNNTAMQSALLSSAEYTEDLISNYNPKQSYFITESDSLEVISEFLLSLPPMLRKRVSFNSGIESGGESCDCAISFTTKECYPNVSATFSQGQITDKFIYNFSFYPEISKADDIALKEAEKIISGLATMPEDRYFRCVFSKSIYSWSQFMELAIPFTSKNVLHDLLKFFSEEELRSGLYQNILTKPDAVYQELVHLNYSSLATTIARAYPDVRNFANANLSQGRKAVANNGNPFSHENVATQDSYCDSNSATGKKSRDRKKQKESQPKKSETENRLVEYFRSVGQIIPFRGIGRTALVIVDILIIMAFGWFFLKAMPDTLKEFLGTNEIVLKYIKTALFGFGMIAILLIFGTWYIFRKSASRKSNASTKSNPSRKTAPIPHVPVTAEEKADAFLTIVEATGNRNADPELLAEVLDCISQHNRKKGSQKSKKR